MSSMELSNPLPSALGGAASITEINDDLLQIILSRIPAQPFAAAACVSRAWNNICSQILSRPKLCSAVSLNPSFSEAVKEVVAKVLSEPIRPQFAILCMSNCFSLHGAHRLITKELGSRIPIITCEPHGVIGRNAVTGEFGEVMYDVDEEAEGKCCGVSLTVGYLPGLKVDVIPLIDTGAVQGSSIDKFVVDIMEYSAAASGCTYPEAVIMFGEYHCDMKPVLDKMNYAMSGKTIVVGNESCHFVYTSSDDTRNVRSSTKMGAISSFDAAALVFARDNTLSNGIEDIKFHLSYASGVAAVGPTYKAVSVIGRRHEDCSWLTAKIDGYDGIGILDGHQMLADLENEMGDFISTSDLYIGVAERRKCSIGPKKVRVLTSLAYHPVLEGDDQYLYVRGLDIKTGDRFRFYVPDRNLALSSCSNVSRKIRKLIQDLTTSSSRQSQTITDRESFIGGILFACCGRGDGFFGRSNVDSSPILDNFPELTLAGMFCGGEIGLGPSISDSEQGDDRSSIQSPLHAYSSVYLLISYRSTQFSP